MQLSSKDLESAQVSEFGRRTVIPLTGMVLCAIAVVVTFVIITAQHQDQQAVESSQRLAQTALKTKQQDVARNVKDYALWQDAFDNLHTKVNLEWAATDGNVGANIYNSLGYDKVFVLSPDRTTVYATEKGKPVTADALQAIPTLAGILPAAAKGSEVAVAFLGSASETLIVGASAILPPNEADAPPVDARSIMVFVKAIDDKFLGAMSRNYLLDGLRFTTGDGPPGAASLRLTAPGGSLLGNFAWTPERPGEAMLRVVLPPLCVALLALIVFATRVLRNARRSAEKIRESAQTIQSYALQLLNSSETRFRDVAEASSDWIWETDAALRFTFVSDRIHDVTGLEAAELVGTPLLAFFSSDTAPDGRPLLAVRTGGRDAFRDLRCSFADKGGHVRVGRIAGRPVLGEGGDFLGFRGTAADVTAEVEAQERANHLALHDALTGLPNRVLLKDRLACALERVRREGIDVAVLCLDIDHFKDVNDTLGHSAGDVLLQLLARRFGELLRGVDTIARLGGDEFAIVQVDVERPENVERLAQRLIAEFKKPFTIEGSDVYVGVSIGIALAPGDGMSQDDLLKHADLALYRAKQAGRGTFRFFEPVMDSDLQARKLLEQDLRRALVKDELQVFYQPLVSVTERELKGVEALLRWCHPTKGMVSPGEFIPLAEETGLIVSIGEWVLRNACRQVVEWPGLLVAVNVSAIQFRHGEFVDTVRRALRDTGLEPHRLELEITESVLLHDTEAAFATLTVLKEIGVRIAMDDFGTGYSSLGYLNSFAFDKIKIDRSFIDQVAQLDKSSAIVRSVISLGQSLNMITTAEGVETPEQLEFLRSEGCDEVQGYFFGRPMPASELHATFHVGQRLGTPFTCGTGLLRGTPPLPEAGAPETGARPRRRSRPAASADRREVRDAVEFAHRRGKTLNLMLSLRGSGAGDVEAAAARLGRIRPRIDDWFAKQSIDGRALEAFTVSFAQATPGSGEAWHHVMVHCPSGEVEAALRRTLRSWCRRSGEALVVRALEWERDERTGRLRCLTANPVSERLEGGAAAPDAGQESWSVAVPLDREARAAWKARRALHVAARRSDAIFHRAASSRGSAQVAVVPSHEPLDA